MSEYAHTLLRPHWRPTHNATPTHYDRWLAPDGADAWCKILNPDGHLIRQVWAVAPHCKIDLRVHGISEQKAEMYANPIVLARQHMEFWWQFVHDHGLLDRLHDLAFEGINEASWEPHVLPPVVTYYAEFIKLMGERGLPPSALQMNTGWPTNHSVPDAPPDWSPFEPVRLALLRYGGYLAAHEYCDIRGPDSPDWLWNMGRIFQIPDSWGEIPVLITECGYDLAVNAPPGTPNHGYIGKLSQDQYMAHLTEYDRRMRRGVVDYPNKPVVQALMIFTDDYDQPWDDFDTRPLRERLALHAEWVRSQPPLVVQPPPPTKPAEQPIDHGVVIAPAGVNVRTGPGIQHAKVDALALGTRVDIFEVVKTVAEPWYRIGADHWAISTYIRLDSATEPPVVPPTTGDKFRDAMTFVYRWEGGFQNLHHDKGNWTGCAVGQGENKGTNKGISACSYPDLDIRNLTDAEIEAIYFRDYWRASGAADLPPDESLLVMDTAVLHGVGTAKKWLAEEGADPLAFAARRLEVYIKSDDWQFWGNAWVRRVADLLRVLSEEG